MNIVQYRFSYSFFASRQEDEPFGCIRNKTRKLLFHLIKTSLPGEHVQVHKVLVEAKEVQILFLTDKPPYLLCHVMSSIPFSRHCPPPLVWKPKRFVVPLSRFNIQRWKREHVVKCWVLKFYFNWHFIVISLFGLLQMVSK